MLAVSEALDATRRRRSSTPRFGSLLAPSNRWMARIAIGTMTDIVGPSTRSRMMSAIGGKNTQPELRVRRYLHAAGLRYSLHRRDLTGRPDIVLPAFRSVVFVHGCFWHRHPGCRYATTPETRHDFWEKKFRGNVARDELVSGRLREAGWRVLVIWECETRDEMALDRLFWQIVAGEDEVTGKK